MTEETKLTFTDDGDLHTPALDHWLDERNDRAFRVWMRRDVRLPVAFIAYAVVCSYGHDVIVTASEWMPTKLIAIASLDDAIKSEAGGIMGAS